jgi:hypothetical protein
MAANTYAPDFVKFCASTYPADLAALDAKVAEAKRAGWTKASRSSLIRAAVEAYDVKRYAGERKAGV